MCSTRRASYVQPAPQLYDHPVHQQSGSESEPSYAHLYKATARALQDPKTTPCPALCSPHRNRSSKRATPPRLLNGPLRTRHSLRGSFVRHSVFLS
ncbi:hypothetical protein TNCT_471171 [Trichonephila clavata]|uniref:Uncharacterized protein n=1 Tax=Trichonephila clavata TaxID=2740835 RepID=A0A8X6L5R8_TRICU|nr:hypothetical protein TNCT_471171 [Trichonephila clavata]